MNQSLQNTIQCVVVQRPAAWCTYLLWVEYAQVSMHSQVSAAVGISPFTVAPAPPF